MKPEKYLNDRGVELFNRISLILKDRGMDDDIYSIELSILCNEYSKYEDAQEEIKKHGSINVFDNGTVQVNAYTTLSQKSIDAVSKLSVKFGLTPKDHENIKSSSVDKKEEKASPMSLIKSLTGTDDK